MSNGLLGLLRVLEIGDSLALAVCGRMFAELGAEVLQIRGEGAAHHLASTESELAREVVDALKLEVDADRLGELASEADLVLVGGDVTELEPRGWLPEALRALAPTAVIAAITPFGLTGPHRDWHGSDLLTFQSSGVARLLLGPVEHAEVEPPVRAAGEQSAYIGGIAAACAAMQALYQREATGTGAILDISAQETMAILPAREHSMPGYGMLSLSREKRADVLGASYILPTVDGYVAASPREEHQWQAWTALMGSPDWVFESRFATHPDRLQRADELIPLMSDWTRQRSKAELAAAAQAVHVPCFAVNGPLDVLDEPQIAARRFLGPLAADEAVRTPRGLFGLDDGDYRESAPAEAVFTARTASRSAGERPLPLAGVRVLDLSWVIAGPTTTRYLAALGAEVVKVESPSRADPGHRSELHAVLGRGKRDLAIDLKAPEALEAVRRLAKDSDIVVENFATGALERLGLGYDTLCELRSDIILLSASGLGRTGPSAGDVAYGTLVQCFAGFADLNGYEDRAPATGFAWSDPVLGLLLPFAAAAALSARDRTGEGRHIDLAMSESLLWTMPGTLIEAQRDGTMPRRFGNRSRDFAPHDVYQAAGDDQWVAIAVTTDEEWTALVGVVDGLGEFASLSVAGRREQTAAIDAPITDWTRPRDAREAAELLQTAGVPASASLNGTTLFEDEHLWARGFYESVLGEDGEARAMVGLPWRWEGGTRALPRAPHLGEHNTEILRELAGLSEREIDELRAIGAFGELDSER